MDADGDDDDEFSANTTFENDQENDLSILVPSNADDDDDELEEGPEVFQSSNNLIKMLVDGKVFELTSGNQGKCLKCDNEFAVHGIHSLTRHLVSLFKMIFFLNYQLFHCRNASMRSRTKSSRLREKKLRKKSKAALRLLHRKQNVLGSCRHRQVLLILVLWISL